MSDEEWIESYNKFYIESIEEHNRNVELWLEDHLTGAKDAYYNTGDPIMSDLTYDRFERWLKIKNPDHPLLIKVGS